MPRILATSTHTCGGDRIPSDELGWYCVCPEPECQRRQNGIWPTDRAVERHRRARPRS
ncbi:hypothetical protein [Micromonospora tarensis]|uniref:Uncharacterized protein n=1 Tax=Micromonospora tarensis TaxID=2806100 RepID=A0ABS1YCE0_9ACTN|nr:hypothetical protein [Micromonospora tarensis]MBM0275075.1 hypothetical protein [Micromonospora tarensis]